LCFDLSLNENATFEAGMVLSFPAQHTKLIGPFSQRKYAGGARAVWIFLDDDDDDEDEDEDEEYRMRMGCRRSNMEVSKVMGHRASSSRHGPSKACGESLGPRVCGLSHWIKC
jgi:hypothetical protein